MLVFILAQVSSPPAWSQLINLPKRLENRSTIAISQAGNIDIADIRLDGEVLFQVGAPTPINPNSSSSVSPIERRVNTITFQLKDIVQDGFDPDTLAVVPAVLNNQTVIVASDQDWGPRLIVTVTQPDVEIAAQLSIEAVAQEWSKIIEQALLQAREQRQPAYLKAQIPYVLRRLALTIVNSLVIFGLQKFRWARYQAIKRQKQALEEEPSLPQPNQAEGDLGQPESGLARDLSQLPLAQQASLNLLVRPILLAAQVSIWHVGIASMFDLFPQTRALANWLLRVPLGLIAVPLGMLIAKEVVEFMLLLLLRLRKQALEEKGLGHNRLDLRFQTLMQVLKELTSIIIVLLGILLFFYLLQSLYIALIILGGLAYLGQDGIKNYVQTFFILFEDQYLLGDVISIESTSGKAIVGVVENMTARVTKLRNLDGKLITIPHGNIVEVMNLTYQWSRVNLGIDVAYSTDLDRAMAVIEQVAQDMQSDPAWKEDIIEEPTILGVDDFGDNSITIRLLIKTQPGKQWKVGREYRRRLKSAFDEVGIDIPFPQRSIWFENALQSEN